MTDELPKVAEADHERIWLAPKCHDADREGRQWCQDNQWETCEECGLPPVEYVRADRLTALEATIAMHERNEQIHGDTLLALNDAENKIAALEAERAKSEARVGVLERELSASLNTMTATRARCKRWGKSHGELDVAIEETCAALAKQESGA